MTVEITFIVGMLVNITLPKVVKPVSTSIKRLFFRSISKPKWEIKSAPRIGFATSAIMKFHGKFLLKPTFKEIAVEPYVPMILPFAAVKSKDVRLSGPLINFRGKTLTSAPESIKYCFLLSKSVTKRRRVSGLLSQAANVDNSFSFPASSYNCMVPCIW